MIGRIAGIILHRASDHVMIDVRGVGYIVQLGERTAAALPPVGLATALYTEMVVREDLMQLIGFTTLIEKEWYRLLTSVQGVGAKAALAILGNLPPDAVGRAIAIGDWGALRKAPGVGPKIAQRIVNELKDRAPAVMAMGGDLTVEAVADIDTEVIEGTAPAPKAAHRPPSALTASQAMSALTNLGYGQAEAASAVSTAQASAPDAEAGPLIRAALQLLAPKD